MTEMKEMDCVEIIVEKEKYTRAGVHKGMQGWICFNECSFGHWLVNFPQYGAKKDIATISVKEDHMKIIAGMDARVNEQIKEQFEKLKEREKSTQEKDLSGYLL